MMTETLWKEEYGFALVMLGIQDCIAQKMVAGLVDEAFHLDDSPAAIAERDVTLWNRAPEEVRQIFLKRDVIEVRKYFMVNTWKKDAFNPGAFNDLTGKFEFKYSFDFS